MASILLPNIVTNIDGNDRNTDLISFDFIKNRVIYLNGTVSGEMAVSIISQLRYLKSKSDRDIYLIINSTGGSVSDGLAIFDAINSLDCDVVTVATGIAASMGSFLVAAGTKGKRYVTENAEIMIHQPLGGVQGQATDISLVAEHIQKVKEKLARILADRCDKRIEKITKDMERDYWMNSEEAVAYGIVDCIGFPKID